MFLNAVSETTPTFMPPHEAAKVLMASLMNPLTPRTVSDAAAESGLSLRDADRGLNWLTSTYRGHLRVTEEGQLLHFFPYGFTTPWETRDALRGAVRTVGKVLGGVARFVVRAWLTVVILGYVGIFLALALGLTLARQSGSSDRDGGFPGGAIVYVLFRVLADALFWTFHPFSPLAIGARHYREDEHNARRDERRALRDETPFYEKVNRFVFGPAPVKEDPRAMERRILAEIRAQKGRIGLGDVMRVTGLPREQADPMMARLMLDYEGEVEVSSGGGITYRFAELRKTTGEVSDPRPAPAWSERKGLKALTGNGAGTNILIGLLNAFNLLMGLFVIDNNLTLARIVHIFASRAPHTVPVPMPYDGLPVALGLIPLVFSVAILLLPLGRALVRPLQQKKLAHENGRLGLLREILTRIETGAPLTQPALTEAWHQAAGVAPEPRELTREIVDLGGGVDIQEATGEVRYRFVDLETEAEALEAEREAAAPSEAQVGRVIFGSDR